MTSWSLHQGLYFLIDLFSGPGLFVNLNLHQISEKMIHNMTIFGKIFFSHRRPTCQNGVALNLLWRLNEQESEKGSNFFRVS